MKKLFFSLCAAVALLASPAASAQDRPEARNDNYGYDKNHRVTPEERARWEAAHQDGRKGERRADRKERRKDDGVAARKDDQRNDRKDKDFNYGFDRNHKVTPQERARWEEAHKSDNGR